MLGGTPLRAVGALLLGLAACGGGDVLRPTHRLVELTARPTAAAPTATLQDDTRPVLRGWFDANLIGGAGLRAPADGPLALAPRLPWHLAGAPRVVLEPQVRVGAGWRRLPARIADVERDAEGAFVRTRLELPPAPAGAPLDVSLRATALAEGVAGPIETPALAIPAQAALEFAIGVLEPAAGEGPVEFRVESCTAGACAPLFRETFDPAAAAGGGWQERSVPLTDLSGQTRSLRFETRARAGAAFSLPVWANPTVVAREPRRPDEHDVIVLSVDTLRADHLPSYGYARETAPFVDEGLARQGTLFETFVAAAATTGPAHMSLFTSLHPSVHGILDGFAVLPTRAVTLAELLRAQGYATAAVTEDGPLSARQFGRGFDAFSENKSAHVDVPSGQVDRTFTQARRWLERHGDRRFFLFLHTFQVHAPYAPPPAYERLFEEAAGAAPPARPGDAERLQYDREIRYVDDELRAFFGFLEARGLLRHTIFVLLSDHGDAFLEHGLLGHGADVHAEVMHVPLVFRGPGVARGRRVARPVAHVDLMPTLLELVGVTPPASLQGRSFAPLLRAGAGDASAAAPAPIFSEAWYRWGSLPGGKRIAVAQPTFAVRVGDRKLIRVPRGAGFGYAYYDLAADPGERVDLAAREREAAGELRALLDAYPAGAAAARAALEAGGPAAPAAAPALDPEREEKLRALGYVE
jgi:arylsulfatase A-like enzyme